MKTLSISFLLLVAFPIHLMAQDSAPSTNKSEVTTKYFVYIPTIIESTSNHIIEPSNTSNRKSATSGFKMPVIKAAVHSNTLQIDAKAASDFVRVASLQSVSEIIPDEVIKPPTVLSEAIQLNDVTRPTPGNTEVIISAPPEPAVAPETAERSYQDVIRSDASVMPERVSLDDIQMSQRGSFQDKEPSTMRDTVDHFSPGGQPFARRNIVGNPNLFGVDRNSCCDEWAGLCNCSGGLKVNPGHLGNPYLRSRRDNCDPSEQFRGKHCGCKSCQRKKTRGCTSCGN